MTTMNVFDMSDTWNSAGTTFDAIKMNVTDTASAAGSLLLNLQVGGVTKASITKQGRIVAGASYQYANPQFYDSTEGTTTGYGIRANSATMYVAGTANLDVGDVTNGIRIRDELWLGWAPGHALSNPADTRLYRDAANTLALRNGLNSQVFRVYQTFTSIAQNAYLNVRWAGTDCRIQTTSAGAESAGTLTFGTSGVEAWRINASNHLVAVTDNTYDIGATGANRPRNVFVAGYVAPSNLRIEDNAGANGVRLYRAGTGILTLYNTAETDFNRLQFGGTTNAFPSLKRSGSSFQVRLADDTGYAMLDAGEFRIQDDVVLNRDAADTLALRRTTNAQTFRLYETFTTASDYSRLSFFRSGAAFYIAAEAAGTGSFRDLILQAGTSTVQLRASDGWLYLPQACALYWVGRGFIRATGDGIIQVADNASTSFNRLQFGGTTSSFPALKRNSTALETRLADDSAYAPHAAQYFEVTDGITAPGSAAGRARIYVDTADGDLKVVFADGTIKTIVTDT